MYNSGVLDNNIGLFEPHPSSDWVWKVIIVTVLMIGIVGILQVRLNGIIDRNRVDQTSVPKVQYETAVQYN